MGVKRGSGRSTGDGRGGGGSGLVIGASCCHGGHSRCSLDTMHIVAALEAFLPRYVCPGLKDQPTTRQCQTGACGASDGEGLTWSPVALARAEVGAGEG